jgi:hypothetical protein
MIDINDLKQLNSLTANLKEDSESTAQFTIDFLECLLKRYSLKTSLKGEVEIEDIPDEIIKILQSGNLPTKEDLLPLDSETQAFLVLKMMWFAGTYRISVYSADIEEDDEIPSPIDCILAMRDVSAAHEMGSYLFAGLALLMSSIPTYDFVSDLCNNFLDTPENHLTLYNKISEVCAAIKSRYEEDMEWYYDFKDDEV